MVGCIVLGMVGNTEAEIGSTYTQDAIKMCELVSTEGERGMKDGLYVMEDEDGNRSMWTEMQFNHYWTKLD
jgi:hypothetical protein